MTKLTQADIEQARARLNADDSLSIRSLAPDYGVNESTLRRALRANSASDGLTYDIDFEEIPVVFRDYSDQDHHYVYPLGDVHVGSPKHMAARWHEWTEYLEGAPNVSLLNTGDNINAAIIGSKSDVYAEKMTVQDALDYLYDDLEPLAAQNKIDVVMPGNHEDRVWRAVGWDPSYALAQRLDVPHAAAAVLLIYQVGQVQYKFYVRHGTGNGQSFTQLVKGNLVMPTADVILTGHTHKMQTTADEFFDYDPALNRVVRHRRYYASSGSFLAYEQYAAVRGYGPTRIGAPRIWLDGERRGVHVSI